MSEAIARKIIEDAGGKVTEVGGPLPDGTGFMIGSFPLPKDHWLTADQEGFNVPPMPLRMGESQRFSIGFCKLDSPIGDCGAVYGAAISRKHLEQMVRAAGRYAVRCATMNGKDDDFDPDALIQCLIVGMFGYGTENGLSSDEVVNPPDQNPNRRFQVNE